MELNQPSVDCKVITQNYVIHAIKFYPVLGGILDVSINVIIP